MEQTAAVVVLSIDGLGARYLGPYGNTSLNTPGFNRLASQGVLFENVWASTNHGDNPRSWYWDLLLHHSPLQNVLQGPPFPEVQRWTAVLDEEVIADCCENYFEEVIRVPRLEPSAPAGSLEETQLATFFAVALERLQQVEPGDFLLLHSRGLTFPWDAPLAYREALRGEGDPPPPTEVSYGLGYYPEVDPDVLLGWQQAYGAQVMVLDELLEHFADQLQELDHPVAWVLTSPRGFPLGEHGFLGPSADCWYDEAMHVPLLLGDPRIKEPARVPTLIEAKCWMDFVQEIWMKRTETNYPILPNREEEVLFGDFSTGVVRTHSWKFIRNPDGQCELYVKPDDRWEKNNVADRCRDLLPLFDDLDGKMSVPGSKLPPELSRAVQ